MARPVARLDDAGTTPIARVDRASLRPPRTLDDGTKVYDAVLVRVGDELRYPWGVEVATAEALGDPAYRKAHLGLSVTLEHPTDGLIAGDAPKAGKGQRVGRVVEAGLDEDGEEFVVALAIDPEHQQAVETTHREVSEGYVPTLGPPDEQGRVPQVARRPNHVALVPAGRAPSARVRTDAEEAQVEEIVKMLAELMAKMDGYSEKMDAMQAQFDAMKAPAADMEAEEAEAEEAATDRADAAARFDATVQARVAEVAALAETGRALGIETPASVDPVKLRGAILAGLGLDAKRADSADYFAAAVEVARKHRTDGQAAATTKPAHAV